MGKSEYSPEESARDQEANIHGRRASKKTDCAAHCRKYALENAALLPDYLGKRAMDAALGGEHFEEPLAALSKNNDKN